MSTIAAALNSCATLVAVDIVARVKPSTTDRQQVQIGRWAAVGIMVLAVAWSTQGEKFTGIFAAVQQIGAALAPPITAVFVMGVFSKRGGAAAALWTLMIGLALGVTGFLVDTPLVGTPPTRPLLADSRLLTEGLGIPFLRQAFFLTVICMVIFTIISKVTPPPPREKIEGLTWDNPLLVLTRPYRGAGVDPRHMAFALAGAMLCLYVVFR
jgi:SSS family solute:Na+ symporter